METGLRYIFSLSKMFLNMQQSLCHSYHSALCLFPRRTLLGCSTSRVPSVIPRTATSSPSGHWGGSAGCIPPALWLGSCQPEPDPRLGQGRRSREPCLLEPGMLGMPWPWTCLGSRCLHGAVVVCAAWDISMLTLACGTAASAREGCCAGAAEPLLAVELLNTPFLRLFPGIFSIPRWGVKCLFRPF